LLGWDLVGSGKHMDYTNKSKYDVAIGIAVWNNYKPGVIRKDTLTTVNDVTYSDVKTLDNDIVGLTTIDGKIKFSRYYMDTFDGAKMLNTIIHETGHALRLDHRDESDSVMQANVTSVITLSSGDKRNYDYAYDNYY
jgi:predicted Zn-dependent protease